MSIGPISTANGEFDLDALRDLSVAEYDKEYGAPKAKKEAPKQKAAEAQPDEEEIEDTFEDDDEGEEDEEEKASSSQDEEKPEEDDAEDDDEDEEIEEGEEVEKDFLKVKKPNGRSAKLPKDALLDVTINGKVEQMTVREVVKKASGVVHLDRELSLLGREKHALTQQKTQFEEEVKKVNDNASMLYEISQNGNPEDFCQYYAMLKGDDPARVLDTMVRRVIDYANQFGGMTPEQRLLYTENRKLKFQQTLAAKQQAQAASEQERQGRHAALNAELAQNGLTREDWLTAAQEVQEKLSSGELSGDWTEFDVLDYAAKSRRESKIVDAVRAVDEARSKDKEFVARISRAVAYEENVTGTKMSRRQIKQFVRDARSRSTSRLSESLSRKAARVERTGKPTSQNARSRKQEKEDVGTLTLRDHHDRLWGDR